MSDVMLFGVLRMPYEMAMGSELSRRQFYARAQEAVDRLEAAERGAARYQWLRDESLGQWEHPICVSQERSPLGMRYVGPLIGDSLDAAIDAAAQEGDG